MLHPKLCRKTRSDQEKTVDQNNDGFYVDDIILILGRFLILLKENRVNDSIIVQLLSNLLFYIDVIVFNSIIGKIDLLKYIQKCIIKISNFTHKVIFAILRVIGLIIICKQLKFLISMTKKKRIFLCNGNSIQM